MFAYCSNNPVNHSDPAGLLPLCQFACASYQEYGGPSYITDQDHPSIANKRYGLTTVSHGGCGAIATYNALLSLGRLESFDDVLSYYNQHIFQLDAFGWAGTPVGLVAQYFRDSGYNVIVTDGWDEIDMLSKSADASILYYQFPATYWGIEAYGAHFVAYHQTVDGYTAYNTSENNGTHSFAYPSDYGYKDSRYYAIGIFIYN